MIVRTISLVVIVVLMVSVGSASGKYQDTIPPEILEQYDPDVVSGEKPKMVTITQSMIWSLRDQADQGGDTYRLDLDPEKLSTVQKKILRSWIASGYSVLLWGAWDVRKYIAIFDETIRVGRSYDRKEPVLAQHAVNTDVEDLYFCGDPNNVCAYLIEYPADTEVIVSIKEGVLAGRIPLGLGSIYLTGMTPYRWKLGNDKDRWTLNFMQWILGFPVPGAAEVHVAPTRPETVVAEQRDELLLKNGDIISGKLLTSSFTIKASYATLSFDTEQIKSIVFEGAGQNIDMIVLRDGDRLSGVVGPDNVVMQLEGGQEAQIEKDKIKEITIRQ